jgi:hypothetical protein
MATIDECIEFALKNIGLWWRYGISRHCDEWKYIIIGEIFENEIILIPPSLKISESSSNGSYRNTDEVWWRYGISRSCDEWVVGIKATFYNISVISRRSVLLMEETGVPWENHQPVVSHEQTLSQCCTVYAWSWTGFGLTTLMVIGTNCIGSYKSNYHMIMITTTTSTDTHE